MEVLKNEKFLLLTPKMVEFIVRRDTLCLHSEMTVIFALNKWSQYNCRQRNLEPTTNNKVNTKLSFTGQVRSGQVRSLCLYDCQVKMLAGMLHQVRWLTMTPFELQMSHAKFSLLSRREFQSISRVLEHRHCSCPLAGRLEKHRARLARPRCGPHHVSAKFSF